MLNVRNCSVSPGDARLGVVRRCFISALRGLVLFGTVLSGPVRQYMAGFLEVWSGMAERSPARLGHVVIGSVKRCKVWRFVERFCFAGRSTLERGFALHGRVRSFLVRLAAAMMGFVWQSGVLLGMALSGRGFAWSGEVLFGGVGLSGVLYCLALLRRGVAWSDEALHSVVKFGPAMYSVVSSGIIWPGDVNRGAAWDGAARQVKVSFWQGGVEQSEVHQAEPSLRIGKVKRCLVSCCSAGQALVSLLRGAVRRSIAGFGAVSLALAWSCEAGRCIVKRGLVSSRFGCALLSFVRRGPVLQGSVKRSYAMYGMLWLGIQGYGGY